MSTQAETALIEQIEARIGYHFNDKTLLLRALTHRSYTHEARDRSSVAHNETLEFLGDAVLSLVAAETAFHQHPTVGEGYLSHIRAAYVCQANLAQAAKRMGLSELLRAAKAMRGSGGTELPSVLSDAVEALIGATYCDGGLEAARALIAHILGPVPATAPNAIKDARTELQEQIQASMGVTPQYQLVSTSGPGHAPVFVVEVRVGEKVVAQGNGPNKKQAAQQAAREAIQRMHLNEK